MYIDCMLSVLLESLTARTKFIMWPSYLSNKSDLEYDWSVETALLQIKYANNAFVPLIHLKQDMKDQEVSLALRNVAGLKYIMQHTDYR